MMKRVTSSRIQADFVPAAVPGGSNSDPGDLIKIGKAPLSSLRGSVVN